ncbi:methylated-DNA--[protein]-cysteine S-methyltransferase [Campylobacter geochelonis]|uniref:Methylated-DNA--protein-cysteine methyltransferase n=1 Tax=Campylobacter geochelonis TaxID=1780362 RepID=A0A128EJE7_9BACT|nr:methylated-DNA--[protein]-cysteine S-methyltransferase [Campylobacter geochelonis]QKF71164.1 O6-alkylguanine-DNA-alkyltransferase [Campylobacter geochelonis]CZE48532.1 methylated-DNA--protein-cysteine methyltransferase [Campylobacter geochelonis]
METVYLKMPFCILEIKGDEMGICEINFVKEYRKSEFKNQNLKLCLSELEEYFKGNLKEFKTKIYIKGTKFQQDVYKALLEIPYGQICSYKDIATKIGKVKACRAVGSANAKNSIPIIIPCHRVVGKNGFGGYSGGDGTNGLEIKRFLLSLEGVDVSKFK